MKIEPFGVEQWMNAWETRATLNLAETCVDSLTLADLMQITGATQSTPADLAAMKMTYGAIRGSDRLRAAVAALHDRQGPDNVLIAHGTIGANHMVYQALVAPADKVVAITPTYQQHTAIPRSMGAEVVEVTLREADGWQPDWDALDRLAQGAKVIALTNPNNPTGALIEAGGLDRLVAIARANDAWILCDEVYRGTEQGDTMPAIADLYAKGISTWSTSKAFSLAGLRLGWIVGPEALLQGCERHRDYTTISVGMIDDYFAAMALENAGAILERSRGIVRGNLGLLRDWVAGEPRVAFVPPRAGTTALLRVDGMADSYGFCEALIRDTGVMLTPGAVMGMEGYLRIGYACAPEVLGAGLARLSDWLAKGADGL